MFLKLLLIFILTPVCEMALLIQLGQWLGTFQTIGIIVLTGLIGASLAKHQGLRVWHELQASLNRGQLPHDPLIDGLLLLIGGALLITPGVLTDVLGFTLVIPWTRTLVRQQVKSFLLRKMMIRGE